MESIAQAVAERVIDLVVEALDMDALTARIDLNVVLAGRRIIQGATVEGISQEQASADMQAADRARAAYVRRLYRVDPADVCCNTW